MQNHYSLLYREEEREMNKLCNETGVGLIPVREQPAFDTNVHPLLTARRSGGPCAAATSRAH